MNATISASQFGFALQNDPQYVIDFLLGNNFNQVADNLQGQGFNRPTSAEQARKALSALLAAGQGNDFVAALTVDIDGRKLSPELVATMVEIGQRMSGTQGFAKSSDPITLRDVARGLATGALAMMATDSGEGEGDDDAADTDAGTGGTTPPMDPEKKKKIWSIVIWGLVAVTLITGAAFAIRYFRKKG